MLRKAKTSEQQRILDHQAVRNIALSKSGEHSIHLAKARLLSEKPREVGRDTSWRREETHTS
jgi:hypothetical protein